MAVVTDRTAAEGRDLRDTVFVGSLEVDRVPVTNERYARFVKQTSHRSPLYWPQGECPKSLEQHPVVGVDFFDALAFAFWAGGSLPTEEEWIEAAGSPTAYPWGDAFEARRCNTVRSGVKGTTPVGSHPEGDAPSGCSDLCGNVWEMTCTAFGDEEDSIVVKGGSWYDFPAHARLDTRFRARVNKGGNTVGFRVVYGRALCLPAFMEPALVAECIAFRHQDAPYIDDDSEEGGEFDAIVSSLRETAHANLEAFPIEENDGPAPEAVEAALAILDPVLPTDATDSTDNEPAAVRPSLWRRLRRAGAEIAAATLWRRILPCIRAIRRSDLGRPWKARLHAGWVELRRALPGPSIFRCLKVAALELMPPPGGEADSLHARLHAAWEEMKTPEGTPSLRKRLRFAWIEATHLRAVRPFRTRMRSAFDILKRPADSPSLLERFDAAWAALRRRTGPSLWDNFLAAITERPKTLFLVLCVAVGIVAGVLGAAARDPSEPNRTEQARTTVEEVDLPTAPPRVIVRDLGDPEPKTPIVESSATNPADEISRALRDLLEGNSVRRADAERFLVWNGAEARPRIEEALKARLAPDARSSLLYVLAALDEEKSGVAGSPTTINEPPAHGLVVFCSGLDTRTRSLITVVRRTAKAHGMDATVVLAAGSDTARVARDSAGLGRVRMLLDPHGRYKDQMQVKRLPAVAGLHGDGTLAFLAVGDVDRQRIADKVARLAR